MLSKHCLPWYACGKYCRQQFAACCAAAVAVAKQYRRWYIYILGRYLWPKPWRIDCLRLYIPLNFYGKSTEYAGNIFTFERNPVEIRRNDFSYSTEFHWEFTWNMRESRGQLSPIFHAISTEWLVTVTILFQAFTTTYSEILTAGLILVVYSSLHVHFHENDLRKWGVQFLDWLKGVLL